MIYVIVVSEKKKGFHGNVYLSAIRLPKIFALRSIQRGEEWRKRNISSTPRAVAICPRISLHRARHGHQGKLLQEHVGIQIGSGSPASPSLDEGRMYEERVRASSPNTSHCLRESREEKVNLHIMRNRRDSPPGGQYNSA
jgi:hypothetical protein